MHLFNANYQKLLEINYENHESQMKQGLSNVYKIPFKMQMNNVKFNPYKPVVLFMGHRQTNSPRCDAAKRGVPSGAILFAYMIFIEK